MDAEEPVIKIRSKDEIAREFNKILAGLLNRLEKKCRSENDLALIDRVRKRLLIAKNTSLGICIEGSIPFFMNYSEKILDEDETRRSEFVSTINPRKAYHDRYGEPPTAMQDFVFEIADVIRYQYNRANQTEKMQVYLEVRNLLNNCIEYKIARGDKK